MLGNTRKGKQVLNVKAPDAARALTVVEGELVAAIGENRKLVIFPLDQVPEMTRGRGVRLQRYLTRGLSDVKTFKAADGLTWIDAGGRIFTQHAEGVGAWRGNRADAGRVRPDRFLTNNKFGATRCKAKDGQRQLTAAAERTELQLATNRIESSDFSSTAAAVLPKNSFRPDGG